MCRIQIGIKTLSFCVLGGILALSCNSQHIVFQKGTRIIAPVVESNTISLSPVSTISGECMEGVGGIYCIRDSMAVLYLPNSPFCYRALKIDGTDYVDFLRKGRGPDEVSAGFFAGVKKADNRTLLDISAINEHVLLVVDLNETFQTGEAAIYEKVPLPQYAWLSHVIDDTIISEVIYDEDIYSIKFFDKDSLKILRSEQVFGSEQYLADYQQLFTSSMRFKPDQTRLSMAMCFFDEINVFDIVGNDHRSISTSQKPSDEKILKKALRNGMLGNPFYLTQDVTNKYIYGLYLNGEDRNGRQSSTIHVFTWDGKLTAVYKMNEVLVGIAVSEDDTSLYGVSEEEILYKYDIR